MGWLEAAGDGPIEKKPYPEGWIKSKKNKAEEEDEVAGDEAEGEEKNGQKADEGDSDSDVEVEEMVNGVRCAPCPLLTPVHRDHDAQPPGL